MDDRYYDMIFKRKSFHLFRNLGEKKLTEEELQDIYDIYPSLESLYPDIRTGIQILPAGLFSSIRGCEYCILLYSENKPNFLTNIGYIGEQLDLYLVSKNIGTLWYRIGRTREREYDGMGFVIMICIAKVSDPAKFRSDVSRCKRMPAEEFWKGSQRKGITDIVRLAPSACNTQPWLVENVDKSLRIYRYRQPIVGPVPILDMSYEDKISIGIFLCFLELCLVHEKISFDRELFTDDNTDKEQSLVAVYRRKV